jgi:hypothetical protein
MIDQTKKHEEKFLRDLKENFSLFDETQSLEDNLNQIEETFRQPNLLIQSIKEMQRKQEESLNEIQLKLDQMNQVKENLEATNKFKPNLFSLNQEGDTSLFGSIRLDVYSNINSFKSQILTGNQPNELIRLCEFSPNDKWTLLYRGTRDGFGAKEFHSKCDNKSPTLSIFKAKQSKFIFGGFTAVSWDGSSGWKSDPCAFLFSLTNKYNQPIKMKINPNRHEWAIYCHSEYGPIFGDDISIANNSNTTMNSCYNLGYCYKHPQYENRSNEVRTFLAGSHRFQLDEIEVYQKKE